MARFPSPEDLLAEIHRCFGLKASSRERRSGRKTVPNKNRFIGYELEIDGHIERWKQLSYEIFDALELDESVWDAALLKLSEIYSFSKAVELRTWTGMASPQQVLWYALAFIYVPGLARILAFWHLANIEEGLPPADTGMPGEDFWFLPTCDSGTGRIELPIPKVLKRLQSLFGVSAVEDLIDKIGAEDLREDGDHADHKEAAGRTLRKWKAGAANPKSTDEIDDMFMDTVALPGKSEEHPDRIHVRRLLRVALLAQSGYQDLVKYLCPDLPPDRECDSLHNKIIQVIALFEGIYNLTIQANNQSRDWAEQDTWFEERLAPWDRSELLLSILPSLTDKFDKKVNLVAECLDKRFLKIEARHGLEDIVIMPDMMPKEHIETFIVSKAVHLQAELEETERIALLKKQLQTKAPYRILQNEDNYWVLNQLVQSHWAAKNSREVKICEMAIERLKEIAHSAFEQGGAIALALDFLFNKRTRLNQNDRRQVQTLLDETQKNLETWGLWKAGLLRFRAQHALCENRWDDAVKDYKEAMEAIKERSCGRLRGEIAQEAFAVVLAIETLNRRNHEVYYRTMLNFMEFPNDFFPDGIPSFEDAAVKCAEFFWTALYRPYAGIEPLREGEKYHSVEETLDLIMQQAWTGLRDWLEKKKRVLGKSDIKDVRRNSLMMLWLKMHNNINDRILKRLDGIEENWKRNSGDTFRLDREKGLWLKRDDDAFQKGAAFVKNQKENFEEAIRLLVEVWPDQPKIADFKGQTPLMLAAVSGNAKLTRLLLPCSEINAQDYLGRTALHSAVLGRSKDCLAMILDDDDLDAMKTTIDENTALHTVVRCAWPQGVQLIVEAFPVLIDQKNALGQTPLDLAQAILEHYAEWREFMGKNTHQIGDKRTIENIATLLTRPSATSTSGPENIM